MNTIKIPDKFTGAPYGGGGYGAASTPSETAPISAEIVYQVYNEI